ncbi:MAG: phosphoribosylglycinamide formyltransferase [Smithella sp.]|jgi:phosphoribosylglycinamide formyltransferase-1|nr:phosphoribosylglycinamide formyltransferase [Smithella sp.]
MAGLLKLGVLISGGGSNLQSIIDHIEKGALPARIQIVISNNPDAPGLARAQRHGIACTVVSHRDFSSREEYDSELTRILKDAGAELIVLAGFMRILSGGFLRAFEDRVINIHPALLPSFPGTNVQQAAIDYGVKFSGCTVHFVDEGVDTGPAIIQAAVPVLPDDTADVLAARILRQEHRIYPQAIRYFAEGRIIKKGRHVEITGIGDPDRAVLHNPPLDD